MSAGLDEDHDMFAPILWVTARQRALWLALNLATAFLAAWVIGLVRGHHSTAGGAGGTDADRGEYGPDRHAARRWLPSWCAAWPWDRSVRRTRARCCCGKPRGWCTQRLPVGRWSSPSLQAPSSDNARLGVVIGCAMALNLLTAGLRRHRHSDVDAPPGYRPGSLAGGVVVTTVTDVVGFFAFLGLASQFLL